jgi:transcriptional regulator
MPRKKFNQEQADKIWKNYTTNLVDSINEAEKEGLEKGYSSYQIERLWQEKTREKYEKRSVKKPGDDKEST